MLRLLTFGGLTLESDDGLCDSSRPTGLQALAFLARLAVSGKRGLSRERLVADFWPEKDERHALHSLSQVLHKVRRAAGTDALILGTRILRLNRDQIWTDVGDFEDALIRGDRERVVALYSGPFLEGIFVTGAPDFDRWVDGERRRLSLAHERCLRALAIAAATTSDYRRAVDCWRRLAALDPLDGEVALQLAESLIAAGDRRGAVREARLHQELLRSELRAEVEPNLRALIEKCENQDGGERATHTVPPLGDRNKPDESDDLRLLTIEELCARGRQCLHSFTYESYMLGMRYVRRALQLDPSNAQACMTLAWLHIQLSQAEGAGKTRSRGIRYSRRAAELDPGLADAQLALAWAAQLDGHFDDAQRLALNGVSLDPHGILPHSVLGWVQINYGLTLGRWDQCIESAASFARSLELQPRDPAILIAVGALYTLAARYEIACNLLQFGVESEGWPAAEMRVIGNLTLLGTAHLHIGRVDVARVCFDRALDRYATASQLFAPYVNALTHCGLGDVERLAGRYDEAVAHYSRARALLEPAPTLIGCGYLVVRLETRLASAFHRLRMRREEARHAEAAQALTLSRQRYSFNWCWGVSEAELHYDWAVYQATCSNPGPMMISLDRAIAYGWGETPWLGVETAFQRYRADPGLQSLLETKGRRQPLPEQRFPVADGRENAAPYAVATSLATGSDSNSVTG